MFYLNDVKNLFQIETSIVKLKNTRINNIVLLKENNQSEDSSIKISSTFLLNTFAIFNASTVEGTYLLASIAFMVCLVTETFLANSSCVIFFIALSILILFFTCVFLFYIFATCYTLDTHSRLVKGSSNGYFIS